MNKHNILRKGLVCGILVVLVGISIIPMAGSLSMEKQVSTEIQVCKPNSRNDNDTTPPVTTHEITGVMGYEDWFVSDVTIILFAYDDISGVFHTYFSLDANDWDIYTIPFNIGEDGYHILQYYSVDNAGNVEEIKSCCFKIDQRPPGFCGVELYIEDGQYEIIADVCDEMSNIEHVDFYIDENLRYEDYEFPYRWIWNDCEPGHIWHCAIAFDKAGNSIVYDIPINNFEIYDLDKSCKIIEAEKQVQEESVNSDNSQFFKTGFSDIVLDGTMGENGWYISGVTVSFTDTGNNTYYRLSSGDWNLYSAPFVINDDGWHFLEYHAGSEPVELVIIKIDKTYPLIDSVVYDNTLPFKWDIIACAYDETSNVDRVEFYVNDVLVANDLTRPFEYTYYGYNGDIKAVIYDKAGLSTEDSSITPYLQSQSSVLQSINSYNSQNIMSTVSSAGKMTFDDVTFWINGTMGENGWFVSDVLITFVWNPEVIDAVYYSFDGITYELYTEPIIVEDDGEHELWFYLEDIEGNVGDVYGPFDFKIDQIKPSICLTFEKIGWFKIKVTAEVSDETSGVERVEFYYRDVLKFTDYEEPYEWICNMWDGYHMSSARSMVLKDGPWWYDLSGIVYDFAGNYECSPMPTGCFSLLERLLSRIVN